MMREQIKSSFQNESHAFVLRVRLDAPPEIDPRARQMIDPEQDSSGRVVIRVEHVNSTDVSRHKSVDSALNWLRLRIEAVLGALRSDNETRNP